MLRTVELELDFNEASDLLALTDEQLLKRENADAAYLISLDEGHVENNLRLLTHAAGAALEEGWAVRPLIADAGDDTEKTDDPEASSVYGGHAYIIGSHYGKKRGPLHPSRAWFARFSIDDVVDDDKVTLEVVRDKFRLNRIINDALQAADIDLAPLAAEYEAGFITAARDKAEKKGKNYGKRLHSGDFALNIEAASFLANGNLLLGLRFPVTDNGDPILVEVAGVPEMFEGDSWPEAVNVWVLKGAGTADRMVGFRALTCTGPRTFDAVLGNLDAVDKDSLLLDHYPGGRSATSEHWQFELPETDGGAIEGTLINRFEKESRIEGLATAPGGHMLYVVDEDHRVAMHFLRVE